VIAEIEYWKSIFAGIAAPRVDIQPYIPARREPPSRILSPATAWKGIENILADLICRFHVRTDSCLEFGVEYGYSTVALSSFFDTVIGIDTFCGDRHTENKSDIFALTSARLACYHNIQLVRTDYRQWIREDTRSYDLIHVDIVHTYADTFRCGLWSALHAPCVLFHDTLSFPAVKQAVIDIARASGKRVFNFEESYGLGILVE
jgi:predicted O-methyltransferase YrrM